MSIERFDMPSGASVFYRDSDHQYNRTEDFKRADRIPGISTVSKCDGDQNNDPLIDWGVRLDREGVAREAALGLSLDDAEDIRTALSWLASGPSIGQTLKDSGLTWRDIRTQAGDRGSVSHDVLQALSEGVTPITRTGYDTAVVHWWKRARPEPELVEQVVYSDSHNIAGRFDLMARAQGRTVLLDLKTSKFAANSFAIQLNLYRLAAKEAGFPEPDRLMVLQVFEDGTWRELDVPIRPDWALAAIQTYKHGKEIGKHMRAARKQAEAVAA